MRIGFILILLFGAVGQRIGVGDHQYLLAFSPAKAGKLPQPPAIPQKFSQWKITRLCLHIIYDNNTWDGHLSGKVAQPRGLEGIRDGVPGGEQDLFLDHRKIP